MRTSFVDSADGTRLRLAAWGDGPRDVLIVHGLAEHADRYGHVGDALAARGWSVTLLELRGHGHSGGRRGYISKWSEYAADLRAATAGLRPGYCAVGHSMGGLVCLDALRDGFAPARLALSNPLLAVKFQPPRVKVAAARVLSKLWPSLALYNELKPEWLSRDLSVGQAYKTDKLVFDTATPRWYTEMVAAMQRVHADGKPGCPVGMFVGTDDPITDPEVNQGFAKKHATHLAVYPEFRHEIFNEIGKERAIAEVADWLESA